MNVTVWSRVPRRSSDTVVQTVAAEDSPEVLRPVLLGYVSAIFHVFSFIFEIEDLLLAAVQQKKFPCSLTWQKSFHVPLDQ
jgi:hypothetical protein